MWSTKRIRLVSEGGEAGHFPGPPKTSRGPTALPFPLCKIVFKKIRCSLRRIICPPLILHRRYSALGPPKCRNPEWNGGRRHSKGEIVGPRSGWQMWGCCIIAESSLLSRFWNPCHYCLLFCIHRNCYLNKTVTHLSICKVSFACAKLPTVGDHSDDGQTEVSQASPFVMTGTHPPNHRCLSWGLPYFVISLPCSPTAKKDTESPKILLTRKSSSQ